MWRPPGKNAGMGDQTTPGESAAAETVDAARESGFGWLVRGGFVARGVIYGIIGGLALALALGAADGTTTSQQGAIGLLSGEPLGSVAVGALAVGLLAYAVWQIGQAVLGRRLEDSDRQPAAERIGQLVAGIAYLGLSVIAVKVLFGGQTTQSGSQTRAAAGVLGWPGGPWIVGLAGVVLVGICVYMAYDGLTTSFLEQMNAGELGPRLRRALDVGGRVGLAARAIVFALIGYFLIRSAIDFDPAKAVGLDGALANVAHEPYGSWLLGIVAVGLLLFAVCSLAEARYREL
jgi:Domain of Unknown Function (DUF1206)